MLRKAEHHVQVQEKKNWKCAKVMNDPNRVQRRLPCIEKFAYHSREFAQG